MASTLRRMASGRAISYSIIVSSPVVPLVACWSSALSYCTLAIGLKTCLNSSSLLMFGVGELLAKCQRRLTCT